jgi:hypothetical protein
MLGPSPKEALLYVSMLERERPRLRMTDGRYQKANPLHSHLTLSTSAC